MDTAQIIELFVKKYFFSLQVRKDGFKDNPAIVEGLDLVEEDDQFTHMLSLDDATAG